MRNININRLYEKKLKYKLQNNPIVAILGVRQCGKTTLAKNYLKDVKNSIFLDLEKPSDRNKLQDPETFFEYNRGKIICLDEVQKMPELYPIIRNIVDENKSFGQFLLVGSASPQIVRKSSESLAGRISFLDLTPFLINELKIKTDKDLRKLWLRGGFPRSYLAKNNKISFDWLNNFIRTYIEQDIPALGFKISLSNIHRLWQIISHLNGQILNKAMIGKSLSLSSKTIQHYIDILENSFTVRILQSHYSNTKKRVIKSPKIFIRDTGLLHALLNINSFDSLLGHPQYGFSWESFAMENILGNIENWRSSYYRESNGCEIDLILENGNKKIAVEFKASKKPYIPRCFYSAIEDVEADESYIISPIKEKYPIKKNIFVISLNEFIQKVIT